MIQCRTIVLLMDGEVKDDFFRGQIFFVKRYNHPHMMIRVAQLEDYLPWLNLAAEVEDLFGPMVGQPGFEDVLKKNFLRGTALCVREEDGPPGSALLGGLFYSPKPPVYKISWLVVSQCCQRQGIGQGLVDAFLGAGEASGGAGGDDLCRGRCRRRCGTQVLPETGL
jgi:ribosomal protein S18 acetylase RimI-like enzyme